jgi:hypothetical protein
MVATILVLFREKVNFPRAMAQSLSPLMEDVEVRLSYLKSFLTTKCAKYAKGHNGAGV